MLFRSCHDLRNLIKGVTLENSRRCLLCNDNRQPKTILELGHLDDHLRICLEEGLDAVTAIRMATLNAAECFRLYDRGAIAPGLRADIVLLDDLSHFKVRRVLIGGVEVAREGKYLPPVRHHSIASVTGSIRLKDFSEKRLKMRLSSGRVNVIGIIPDNMVTRKKVANMTLSANGDFSAEIGRASCRERV